MNSFHDPSKKTSIISLLNPPTAADLPFPPARIPTSAPTNQRQHPPQGQHPTPHTSANAPYSNGASYNLRAANWGGNVLDSRDSAALYNKGYLAGRRPSMFEESKSDIQGRPTYHQHKPEDRSVSQGPPMGRHRATSIQSMTGIDSWQHSADSSAHNSSYGSAPPKILPESHPGGLAPRSSFHERPVSHTVVSGPTPMSHGLQAQSPSSGSGGYQNSSIGQPPTEEWQSSERASVRLAVRGLMPSPAPQPQGSSSYYAPTSGSSYPILVAYSAAGVSPSQDQVLPPSQQQGSAQTQPAGPNSTASKRQLPESEAYATTPKAKRLAKAKPKVGVDGPSAPSKRGFNAKKRSEAAQIAAQNAQLTASASIDEGKDKATDSRPSADGGPDLLREVQFARCMSNRYRNEDFPRCVSCTRRWAGDTCRFQGIRCFIKDQKKEIVAVSFMNAKANEVPVLQFPSSWNVPLKQEHIGRCKKVIAKALLSTLKVEREHLNLDDLIRRARESDVRVTCDTCMTSIFSSSWMCRLCGREACADCFAQVRELTEDKPGASHAELAEMQKKREKHAHSNPFFLSCTRRNEHQMDSFSPMSRFFAEELNDAIKEMEKIVAEEDRMNEDEREAAPSSSKGVEQVVERPGDSFSDGDGPINWSEIYKSKEIKLDIYPRSLLPSRFAGESYVPSNLPEAVTTTPYYKISRYYDNDITGIESADKFAKIWAFGEPILIANVLYNFKIAWSPEYFIQQFGDRECLITECEQDANKKTTIKEFFGQFGRYGDRKEVWKLKDWPPSADFKVAFPKLFKDFSDAVPVPDYVRRDGVYNIGSHFPSNVVGPDLGPKMYNAWAANQNPGSKGSTRLHMDMADAMNVMLYASHCPDGSPGCAVWDIYRTEDSDKIREFLRKRYSLGPNYDPIHGQQYYLDDLLRAQLYKEHGVCSYRVYQRPGEAIFVPAGCAHQVSNLADSIKIAIDYVSPENIDRCTKLTQEFREQNKSKVWKEDVLQLKTMMWFAWLSCSKQENASEVQEVQQGGGRSSPNDSTRRRESGSPSLSSA